MSFFTIFTVTKNGGRTKLNELIYKYDYLNIEKNELEIDLCNNDDQPSCITEVTMENGEIKKIHNYHGSNEYPRILQVFETKIDRIVNTKKVIESKILNYFLLIENNNYFNKDFHFLSSVNETDAVELINETIYSKEDYKVSFWNIINLGYNNYNFCNYPIIYTSFLKKFNALEQRSLLNLGKNLNPRKVYNLLLLCSDNARYNELECDYHLIYANSEKEAIKYLKKEYKNYNNEKIKIMSFDISFINKNTYFDRRILFSKFKTNYKPKYYWSC